uniref:RNA replicase n=1 Tax=Beihai noda-like virus 30 TaxID=1922485 RepID=A0A1L3KFI1_9VIRU|nr:hypothetical protein [Beihai noda-like virus 30]
MISFDPAAWGWLVTSRSGLLWLGITGLAVLQLVVYLYLYCILHGGAIVQQLTASLIAGPFAVITHSRISRFLQRNLVNLTRVDQRASWFPLKSLIDQRPTRLSDNGHATSGAVRDAARRLISGAISAAHCRKVEISPGGHTIDEDNAIHLHVAVGDLHRPLSYHKLVEGDILAMIDVDYYIAEPDEYFGQPVPFILHTFQPTTVAGSDGDVTFKICDNIIDYKVDGGGRWQHQIWDWCNYGEYLEFCPRPSRFCLDWWLSWIGIQRVQYQKVHHARPWLDCPMRALVWGIPQFSCLRFTWLAMEIQPRRLCRVDFRDPRRPDWNVIVDHTQPGKLTASIGRAGDDAHVEVSKTDLDIIKGLSTAQSVSSRLLSFGYQSTRTLALIGQYYGSKDLEVDQYTQVARPATVMVHWPVASEMDTPETSMRSYGAPVVKCVNLCPQLKRWEVLSNSLEYRVSRVVNNKLPRPAIGIYAEEFVRLVVPDRHKGAPLSLEETVLELNKPSQVLAIKQIWETVDMPHRSLIEAFVKNEPTNKAGRIISSFPDMRYLLKFSSFTIAFRDNVLHSEHNSHWFCPGLTPPAIAKKVVGYVRDIVQPVEGDFFNFDGTVSEWCQRHVMNAVYHRWFARQYCQELTTYTDDLISCPARAKRFGFRYEAGVGVKSGSPTTCDLNTVLNAFIQYVAVRRTKPELPKELAYSQIGLAFGDDSLFDDQYTKEWNWCAKQVGMNLKVERCDPTTGVTFLARVFPDPWNTETSFQDPMRTFRKLHLTARPNIPYEDAALDRVAGYLTTDKLTPVISDYCSMIERCYGSSSDVEKRRKRKDANREKPYWLTVGGAWPQSPTDVNLMLSCVAARTGFTEEQLTKFCEQCKTVNSPWDIKSLDTGLESPYTNTLDVDGLPVDAVDDRQINHERELLSVRACEGIPGEDRTDQPGPESSDRRAAQVPRPKGSQRPGCVSRLSQGDGEPRVQGDGLPIAEAQGGGSAQGKRGGTGKSRPPRRGKAGHCTTFRSVGGRGKNVQRKRVPRHGGGRVSK